MREFKMSLFLVALMACDSSTSTEQDASMDSKSGEADVLSANDFGQRMDQRAPVDLNPTEAAPDTSPRDAAVDGPQGFVCGAASCTPASQYCDNKLCPGSWEVPDSGLCPAGCEIRRRPGSQIDFCAELSCEEMPAGCSGCGCFTGECSPRCVVKRAGELYVYPGLCGTL